MRGWFAALSAARGRKRHRGLRRWSRKAAFDIIEEGPSDRLLPKLVDLGLVALICVNVLAVCLETVPEISAAHEGLFLAIEVVSVAIFTVEYAVRIWVAPEHLAYSGMGPGKARLRYALSPFAVIDLLAILPFYLAFLVPFDLRVLRVFRLVRFFKLTRYSTGMRSLARAVQAEWRALAASLIIMAGLVLVAAAVMHMAERNAQPDAFGSIPQSLWWAVVTLTTVGYGDVVPQTVIGRMLGSVVMLFGLAMFALPLGIVATAFAQEVHRRDFVVNWSMVARVPLFRALNAEEIAEIMALLKTQTMQAGAVIARRGEPAQAMYFVASGEVELEVGDRTFRLGTGEFFGEMAVLRKSRRSATATAVSRVHLLILSADDFHVLMSRRPEIGERIREMAEARLRKERVGRSGDITAEELETATQEPEAQS